MTVKKLYFLTSLVVVLLLTACKPYIDPEKLYGRWNYVSVDKPHADLPDTVSAMELDEQKPYIEFKRDHHLLINWGGKILSQGTYAVDGKNINYTESLPDGKTRTFPYFVSEFTGKEIIFETTDQDGSRVKAVKTTP